MDFLLSEKRFPSEDAGHEFGVGKSGNVVIASQSGSGALPSDQPLPELCAATYSCREREDLCGKLLRYDAVRTYSEILDTSPNDASSATCVREFVQPIATDRRSCEKRPRRHS